MWSNSWKFYADCDSPDYLSRVVLQYAPSFHNVCIYCLYSDFFGHQQAPWQRFQQYKKVFSWLYQLDYPSWGRSEENVFSAFQWPAFIIRDMLDRCSDRKLIIAFIFWTETSGRKINVTSLELCIIGRLSVFIFCYIKRCCKYIPSILKALNNFSSSR